MSKGTLTDTEDAYQQGYSRSELYIRKVMHDTAMTDGPSVYEERAKLYLAAEEQDIHLPAFVLEWAKKVLNTKE